MSATQKLQSIAQRAAYGVKEQKRLGVTQLRATVDGIRFVARGGVKVLIVYR